LCVGGAFVKRCCGLSGELSAIGVEKKVTKEEGDKPGILGVLTQDVDRDLLGGGGGGKEGSEKMGAK